MIPKYLYHYSTVDTLKAILENKTIRFTRLDLLNDPFEGYCEINEKENLAFRKRIYCSCWTNKDNEDVALWQIYTKSEGVRLKIDSKMFSNSILISNNKSGYFPIQPISRISIRGLIGVHNIPKVYGQISIKYCEKVPHLFEKCVSKSIANEGKDTEFEMNDIDLLGLGINKLNVWAYENEWRFLVSPFISIHSSNNLINQEIDLGFPEYIDVPLLSPIEEVITGPEMPNNVFLELKDYLSKKHPYIRLIKSKIKTKFNK